MFIDILSLFKQGCYCCFQVLMIKMFLHEKFFIFVYKQAENGLQSRSSDNGKTAVGHFGLKLQ